ncbi:type VI secretion system protein TssA [Yersinia sp. J1]|uniref:type VI secretion system protein TssA n=1 Tax=Yersinia sp. J1 TaxID=3424774 RepID=UPI003D36649E
MNAIAQHPWRNLLLAPLADGRAALALKDDNPRWEFIDGEMVKLGSLTHASLNIAELQQQAMTLLSEESKDMRLLTHLLRTLQHGGEPQNILLAMQLLCDYVSHFWAEAWPHNGLHKRRLAQQIVKRFDAAASLFSQRATGEQRLEALGQLARLAQCWHDSEPQLAKEVDELSFPYRYQPEPQVADTPQTSSPSLSSGSAPVSSVDAPVTEAPIASVTVDSSSDRAWRQTLLKVADLLCERHPDSDSGYRLRRHAVFSTITTPPQSQSDGRTPLAAVSADRTASYQAALPAADLALWQQIEQSLTLAPYWLDGHFLSAQVAERLGYPLVAQAIQSELRAFLARLPALRELSFTDKTPFLSVETAAWLQPQETTVTTGSAREDQNDIWQCYEQQGLEAALAAVDQQQQQQTEPRDRFYSQLLSAQLLEKAGLAAMAQQQYQSLYLAGKQLSLPEWEPSLFAGLSEKQRRQNS